MVRQLLKRAAFLALGGGFALKHRIAAIRRRGPVTILNLHRIAADQGNQVASLSPIIFDYLLDFLNNNFNIITLSEIHAPSTLPKLVLSFDDGYRDFFQVAVPILNSRKIRVNQNIIPECIETQRPPLNILARDFISTAPQELVRGLRVPGFSELSGRHLGHRLSSFLKNRPRSEQERLADKLIPQFLKWDGFVCTQMMSREEVTEVARVHELGAHSYSHASMAYESNQYLRNDLRRCGKYFEEIIGQKMHIYAFPNGSYREEQIEIVVESGVDHVLLVGEDFADERSPYKRFTFNAHTKSEARFRALGGNRRL